MNAYLRRVRKHFLCNNPPVPGDAFHMILYESGRKVSVLQRNMHFSCDGSKTAQERVNSHSLKLFNIGLLIDSFYI